MIVWRGGSSVSDDYNDGSIMVYLSSGKHSDMVWRCVDSDDRRECFDNDGDDWIILAVPSLSDQTGHSISLRLV